MLKFRFFGYSIKYVRERMHITFNTIIKCPITIEKIHHVHLYNTYNIYIYRERQ